MSYMALYRKWRPPVFDDVKGQDPIVSALRNQIKTGRMGHAYLFCGTRGTGKTSVAKIFAKAVNCENPKDGNPCNECDSCKAVDMGNSVNVIEIDAASNNSVDDVREIKEEVRYNPTEGRYKVYIIDEVHMLSPSAFNALLKTLEEPPEYVIFILATTEAHRLPITVLSRCQRYDFRRASVDVIAARLKELCDGESVEIEERALRYIARKADGSFRDSISLLDQCIAFHYGECLTYAKVLDVLGAVSYDLFGKLLDSVLEGKTAECITEIDKIIIQGMELNQLVSDFTWYLRNILMIKTSDVDVATLGISEEDLLAIAEMSIKISEETLMRYIRVFSELMGKIRFAVDKRVLVEMAFIKLIRPESESNLDSILNRLEILEKKISQGIVVKEIDNTNINMKENVDSEVDNKEKEDKVDNKEIIIPKERMEQFKLLKNNWNRIIDNLVNNFIKSALRKTLLIPDEDIDNLYHIVFNEKKFFVIAGKNIYIDNIKETTKKITGLDCEFDFIKDGNGMNPKIISHDEIESVFNGINVEFD